MNKEETYSGENEGGIEFNKKITIYRDNGVPYLKRRTLISFGKWFSIKYHQILESDDYCMHDHPWPFLTLILKGGYYETTPETQKDSGRFVKREKGIEGIENTHWHKPFSIMYRPANWIHRLELKREDVLTHQILSADGVENHYETRPVPAHTFVITGKVVRHWGFITKSGWIFWKNYSKQEHC